MFKKKFLTIKQVFNLKKRRNMVIAVGVTLLIGCFLYNQIFSVMVVAPDIIIDTTTELTTVETINGTITFKSDYYISDIWIRLDRITIFHQSHLISNKIKTQVVPFEYAPLSVGQHTIQGMVSVFVPIQNFAVISESEFIGGTHYATTTTTTTGYEIKTYDNSQVITVVEKTVTTTNTATTNTATTDTTSTNTTSTTTKPLAISCLSIFGGMTLLMVVSIKKKSSHINSVKKDIWDNKR